MLSSSIPSVFRTIFFSLLFLLNASVAMAATFSAAPSPSTTGNYLITWSGANSGIPQISEIIGTTRKILATGGSSGTVQVTGKATGRYQYVLEQFTPGTGTGQGAPPQTILVEVILPTSSSRSSVQSSSSSSKSSISSSISSRSSSSAISINVDRSLFVHDQATLGSADFSLLSVMNALAAQMTATNSADPINGTQLFARMWDAQNPINQSAGTGIVNCTGTLNNFPVECRPQEGAQALQAARFISEYIPIGLVNRFDLRDTSTFKDCGEYRVVFGHPTGGRNFIIFEAEVPNPNSGVASGCLPIQNFWKNLTTENNAVNRAAALRNFYFNGLPASNVRAPIDSRNFVDGTGQIRTNQFITGSSWNLKEYKVAIENGKNTLQVATVKSNPVGKLFEDSNTDPRSTAFKNDFVNNLGSLLGSVSAFSLTVSNNAHNNVQSHASGPTEENNFAQHVLNGGVLSVQISNKLTQLGSTLTAQQVVNRATAMTCGGCHLPSGFGLTTVNSIGPGLSWPNSAGFVHVSEFASNGIFPISPALLDVFLPARKKDVENYLNTNGGGISIQSLSAPQTSPAVKTSKRSG